MVDIKKKLGIKKPPEDPLVEKRRKEREEREKTESKSTGIGSIISKIQGIDPRAFVPPTPDTPDVPTTEEPLPLPVKPPVQQPAFPGEVVMPEVFSPGAVDPETLQAPPPEQVTGVNLAQQAEEQRRQEFNRVTGAGQLTAGLGQQIASPPSLKPAGIFSGQFKIGDEEFSPIEKTLTGLAVAGLVGVAAFLIPGVASAFTGAKIAGVLSIKALSIKGIATLAIGGTIGKGVSDFLQGGKKISELESQITSAAAIASTTLSAVQNGVSPIAAMDSLSQSVRTINEAESAIKQLAIYNIKFRLSKEYQDIEDTIRQKRTEIQERIYAIQNIAATGRKSTENTEGLMLDLLELEKLK